ncbi:MAG: hypothetical protein ACREQ2_27660 [Candidatus Binatia bacterium]
MLRPLLSMVLLLVLAFGLSGIHALMSQTTLSETLDEDVSSEEREEQTLRSAVSLRYARGEKRTRSLIFQPDFTRLITSKPTSALALSPLRSVNGTGYFHGLLQVFRI